MKGWILPGAAALLVVVAAAAAAQLISLKRASRDVRGSATVEFVAVDPPAPRKPKTPGVAWPQNGFSPERLRAVEFPHRPPFRRLWMFKASQLVEFPPAIAYGRLYFANGTGVFYAVNVRTGMRA